MGTPASVWILLALACFGALMTVTALVRAHRLGWGNMFWFLSGWLTSELALFHVLLSAIVAACFALASDALQPSPGRFAFGLMLVSWVGLALAQWRARPTRRILEDALQASGRLPRPACSHRQRYPHPLLLTDDPEFNMG